MAASRWVSVKRVTKAGGTAALAALLACEQRGAEGAPAATPPGSPSAQQPPPAAIREVGPGTGEAPDILRYETAIRLDVGARSVRGTTAIVYAAPRAPASLVLPRNGLVLEAVRAGGRAVAFDAGAEQLHVPLPAATGEGRVEIDYQGTPEKGLWFSKRLVHTGYFTCHWMPCREEPGDRATFRLSLVVPEAYQVVAGGRELTRAPAEPGTVRVVWDDERPLATYLFGFAAGAFTEVTARAGDVRLRYVGVDVPAAALERRFQPTADMLRFFSERAGAGLPGPDYTQVLVPGSMAQENSSFSLIGTDEIDPILTDPKEDWVIAHELAHQWWGNAITCKDWTHAWLNEGITTFMVAAYKQQRWGAAAYARELGLFRQRHAVAKEASMDVKLAYAGDYPSLRVQRAIVYSKAALFLDLLRRELGEAPFWGGLRRYTREHMGRSVESRDFQRALEAETGRELTALFGAWVYD